MPSQILHTQAKMYKRPIPDIRPGYTVRVHERIQEKGRERTQVFEGLIIAVHKGHVATDATFTVRRIASGIGVEKVFSLHSPKLQKIEVKKVAKVRRAKLTFLRGRSGKAARLNERFTTAEEFKVAVPEDSASSGAAETTPQQEEEPKKDEVKEKVSKAEKSEPEAAALRSDSGQAPPKAETGEPMPKSDEEETKS